ncbi:YfaZ family outer membrane protein [Jeongeupia sp. USM3]|uniref:YfaZ family outer membrane protein n=1 Tax=Jeongeupia sp. USM3 TaxID=1906741 RepID=UPI00089E078D|nr:YfaZ family outer membrane protein [Jeongeupia sp. USM3]AOY00579.1 hypothetical protein BJP62_09085 [Jeongeupia sp. USM3]
MKNAFFATAIGAILLSAGASAAGLSAIASENYVAMSADITTGGLGLTADWTHNDDKGDAAGIGLGVGVPLGRALLTLGGKVMYLDPKDATTGYAGALGGGITMPLGERFVVYGEGYYSPDSLSSGVESYTEAKAGVRFKITKNLGADVGYKYVNIDSKDGRPSAELANGAYGGITLTF